APAQPPPRPLRAVEGDPPGSSDELRLVERRTWRNRGAIAFTAVAAAAEHAEVSRRAGAAEADRNDVVSRQGRSPPAPAAPGLRPPQPLGEETIGVAVATSLRRAASGHLRLPPPARSH